MQRTDFTCLKCPLVPPLLVPPTIGSQTVLVVHNCDGLGYRDYPFLFIFHADDNICAGSSHHWISFGHHCKMHSVIRAPHCCHYEETDCACRHAYILNCFHPLFHSWLPYVQCSQTWGGNWSIPHYLYECSALHKPSTPTGRTPVLFYPEVALWRGRTTTTTTPTRPEFPKPKLSYFSRLIFIMCKCSIIS